MGWYVDNLGNTPENRARDGMSVSENFANSADSGTLSGYAQNYATARGSGASDAQAHDSASKSTGKSSYSVFTPECGLKSYNVGENSFDIFFPDVSKYLDPKEWLKSGPLNNNLNADRVNNISASQPAYNRYFVDENGFIQKTQSSGDLSSLKAATPTTNPVTGINNNNFFDGQGFAYTDQYGFPHVVNDYKTAQEYARDTSGPKVDWTSLGGEHYQVYANPGEVSSYEGAYGGGYALDSDLNRVFIPLSGAVQYGNANSAGSRQASSTRSNSISSTTPTTSLTADRSAALSNMLRSRSNPTPTTYLPPTDADYDAMLRQSEGQNYFNLSQSEKATIIQMMKVLRGVA